MLPEHGPVTYYGNGKVQTYTWTNDDHYGFCGQSCPCCRYEVGDAIGACLTCKEYNSAKRTLQIVISEILFSRNVPFCFGEIVGSYIY